MLAALQIVIAVLLGLVLPGYLLAGILGSNARLLWSFPLSLLVLFSVVLLAGMLGLPITAPVVGSILLILILVFAWLKRMRRAPVVPAVPRERRFPARAICISLIALAAVVLWRTTLWPLAGFDTAFRWDFLAQCLLQRHDFNFYPPISAADYHVYFYTDGIAPLVSVSYWWLYAAAGGHYPALTGGLLCAQLVWTLWFTYRTGRKLESAGAGWLAAGLLGGSTLYVRSLAIGQETGLTALSLAAMLCAFVEAAEWRGLVLAGFAAALGALAREYGWVIPALGMAAVIWRGGGVRSAARLGAVAGAVAGPWYLRNWIRTGNPFYSNRFGSFHVNAMHVAMLDYCRQRIGVLSWDGFTWRIVLQAVLENAPLQCTVGLAGAVWLFRRCGFLSAAAAVFVLVWLYTVGATAGGWVYSMRVLTPAVVALSLLGGIAMAKWVLPRLWRILVVLMLLWSLAVASVHPFTPGWASFRQWGDAFCSVLVPEQDWWLNLPKVIPAGSRVLCVNTFIAAGLSQSGIDFVPAWSPEVAFLGDGQLSPAAVRRRLLDRSIDYVILEPDLFCDFLLDRVPFYEGDIQNWKRIASDGHSESVYQLPE